MNVLNPSGWRPDMTSGDAAAPATASGDYGLMLEEPLIFELGAPGARSGVDFDDVALPAPSVGKFRRKAAPA